MAFLLGETAGVGSSFGHTFHTRGPALIATLPIGCADGLSRTLSNRIDVTVAGARRPQVGTITLDRTLYDVISLRARVRLGEEAVLIGRQGDVELRADELAATLGTIRYVIVTALAARRPQNPGFVPGESTGDLVRMSKRSHTLEGVLLDLDGVLYEGDRAVPGAADSIAWLRTQRIPFLFVTNTTSRPRSALVEKLAGFGIAVEEAEILTPPVAALHWLGRETSGPVALFVPPATADEFAQLPRLPDGQTSGAAAVVVGDLGEAWDFATLNRAFRLLMAAPAPRLVALGMTRYWRADDGLRLDVAPFVKALEHASGTEAVVLGKPAAPFFDSALEQLGLPANKVAMLGDDVVSDVEAAQKFGLFGILVRTGKFQHRDLERPGAPDAVLDSIAALPGWWPGP